MVAVAAVVPLEAGNSTEVATVVAGEAVLSTPIASAEAIQQAPPAPLVASLAREPPPATGSASIGEEGFGSSRLGGGVLRVSETGVLRVSEVGHTNASAAQPLSFAAEAQQAQHSRRAKEQV